MKELTIFLSRKRDSLSTAYKSQGGPTLLRTVFLATIILTSFPMSLLLADGIYPLAPADTVSPQNTYRYFIDQMNKAYNAHQHSSYKKADVEAYVIKATKCLDLSEVSLAERASTGSDTALILKEVLDRIPTPPYDQIPDAAEVERKKINTYVLPHTEIRIVRVADGPRKGEFLFSAGTVEHAREFYNRVQDLPYKPGASVGAYADYLSQPGSMIPKKLINQLPKWMKFSLWGHMLWQWIGLVFSLLITGIILFIISRWTAVEEAENERHFYWVLRKLVNPLAVLVLLIFMRYFVEEQISIAGPVWSAIKYVLRFVWLLFAAYVTLIVGRGIAEAFISSKRLRPRGINANLIRMLFRLVTIIISMVVLWNGAKYLGVSLTAVFASAGIAGIAIALAAQETLSNFFGGASILLDQPFKAGDYIILDSGERGEVLDVGLRSTRIVTRDEIQISIPNSMITNTKVINESAPKPHFRVRIKVGVAYGSDIKKVEEILISLALENEMVKREPAPCVRLRGFGDSSLDFELHCWAGQAEFKGKLTHDLYWNIYLAFAGAGIVIPFPQRALHIYATDPADNRVVSEASGSMFGNQPSELKEEPEE